MAKNNQDGSKLVNQHKRLAMGEKVTGMKKGGSVMKPMAKMVKGSCMKKGGMSKKGK